MQIKNLKIESIYNSIYIRANFLIFKFILKEATLILKSFYRFIFIIKLV